MIRIHVDISSFSRRFGNLGRRMQPYVRAKFGLLAKTAFNEVQKQTGKTAPGRTDLQKLWRMEKKNAGTKTTYTIHNMYSNWKVLWYREVGTPVHPITGNPYLHFYWEKKGWWVKTPQVTHPGTKPHLMVYLAATHFRDNIRKYEREIMREIVRLSNMGIT